ncbi:MAG: mannitol dehydrogenase [Clostridia bacterium]|nr:mannitol dehydrogenase [Clostridia bacterium]
MKTALITGAGNIGRGFIGQIMYEAGYRVCFLDVVENMVNSLNEAGEYPLDIVSSKGVTRKMIRNVSAVNGNDRAAAARAIADCSILVTCVGAKAIKYTIPNLVAGIKLRYSENKGPLNLLICENLMDADKYIRGLLEPELTAEELGSVGLIETSVGRMVPLPDKALLEKEPLLVRAEAYPVLPCDRDAFVGEIPEIGNVIPVSPFRFIIERKLYIHNMGHAVTAYLGKYKGYTYIWEAISDPEIRVVTREAMTESAAALSKKYDKPLSEILLHTDDLIRRFGNTALGDTCERVGADVPRKMANSDRLTGASLNVAGTGGHPVYISIGAAAALFSYAPDSAPSETLKELSGVCDGEYHDLVVRFFDMMKKGAGVPELIAEADSCLSSIYTNVI